MNMVIEEYQNYLKNGDNSKNKAETEYENKHYTAAARHYYHAGLAYEQAAFYADKYLDVSHKIYAKDNEQYCQEKIDEIKLFRGISMDEAIR